MNVIKKFAPNYWLGYYAVYMASIIVLTARYGHLIVDGSDSEQIFTAAAIFGAATGIALTSALTAEGAGYLVLLIPRRIKQIKDEGIEVGIEVGREGGLKDGIEIGREEGRAEGRAEGMRVGVEEGIKTGIAVGARSGAEGERGRVRRLLAQYESGEITLDDLLGNLHGSPDSENGTD